MSRTLPDTRPHLTRDERDLLRGVFRYCHLAGWRMGGAQGRRGNFVSPDKSMDADWWSYRRPDGTILQLSTLTEWGTPKGSICHAEISSVREAVDIACAYGLLPQDFSSAHRAILYTAPLTLPADQVDVGWQLLDASDETSWHPVTAVLECEDEHAETFVHPTLGEMPGYIAGRCGHRVAGSEWRAGFRVCERCPSSADTGCTILVSTAYQDGNAHMPSDATVDVRIPAGEL